MYGGPQDLPAGAAGVRALFEAIAPVHQTWTIREMIAEGNIAVTRATQYLPPGKRFPHPRPRATAKKFSAIFIPKTVGRQDHGHLPQCRRFSDACSN